MRQWLLMLVLTATAVAAPPTTRPTIRPLPMPPLIGQAIDPTLPAFVPKFARIHNPPAGQFAERRWAYQYGTPGPTGYGGFGFGFGGYGFFGGYTPNAVPPG